MRVYRLNFYFLSAHLRSSEPVALVLIKLRAQCAAPESPLPPPDSNRIESIGIECMCSCAFACRWRRAARRCRSSCATCSPAPTPVCSASARGDSVRFRLRSSPPLPSAPLLRSLFPIVPSDPIRSFVQCLPSTAYQIQENRRLEEGTLTLIGCLRCCLPLRRSIAFPLPAVLHPI